MKKTLFILGLVAQMLLVYIFIVNYSEINTATQQYISSLAASKPKLVAGISTVVIIIVGIWASLRMFSKERV